MKRLLILLSTSVACAILTTTLAMARLQEAARPQDGPVAKPVEVKSPRVKVYKAAPRAKGAAGPVAKKAAGQPAISLKPSSCGRIDAARPAHPGQ